MWMQFSLHFWAVSLAALASALACVVVLLSGTSLRETPV